MWCHATRTVMKVRGRRRGAKESAAAAHRRAAKFSPLSRGDIFLAVKKILMEWPGRTFHRPFSHALDQRVCRRPAEGHYPNRLKKWRYT